jgi:predicted nucleic acid-binding protein
MKILLDTNIVIHREASTVVNKDIGQLFNWIDKLHYDKFIHPITVSELNKYNNEAILKTLTIKLQSYNQIRFAAPVDSIIQNIIDKIDKTENDVNDTLLLNEVYNKRVDILITEDKNIHKKAESLNIKEWVYDINGFLLRVLSTHPTLIDYKVLSVRKGYFGNVNLQDEFFDSFKQQYKGFEDWFNNKINETAYTSYYENKLRGFLYLKVENINENYSDITPQFALKKRLKIGTFKVNLYGVKLGERFIKIIFDNAVEQKVEEIYFTIFNDTVDKKILINLMEEYGFKNHGIKKTTSGDEEVYVRDFIKNFEKTNPKLTFPYIKKSSNIYVAYIKPQYHTELFPDSILRTESPNNFVENEPHRNAILKSYISHSIFRNLKKSDILLFYRTKDKKSGYYESVITTICIVDSVINNIKSYKELLKICRGKTVLSNKELEDYWNKFTGNKPFVLNFLYILSLKKRPNLKSLIEAGIIKDPMNMPRGIFEISKENFEKIIKLSNTDANIIVD